MATTEPTFKDSAGFFAASAFASDVLGSFFGASQRRSQLKIQQEQSKINRILADAEFERNMEQLFAAQQELKNKATREITSAKEQYKLKQSEIRVAQAEKGISGQSAADVHNDLTQTFGAYRQIALSNLAAKERELVLARGSAIDNRTAQRLSGAIPSGSESPLFATFAEAPLAAIDALMTYYVYRGEVNSPDALIDRSTG